MEKFLDQKSEERILDAAKDVFLKEGRAGARMQEIADKAGINKSLLHYYYRTKDKLFEAVFSFAVKHAFPDLVAVLNSDKSFLQKLEEFISMYIDFVNKNPVVPVFMISEINKNPEIIAGLIKKTGIDIEKFERMILTEIEQGRIREISPKHLIINIVSLCIFPVVAKKVVSPLILKNDSKEIETFYQNRKKEVYEFIVRSIEVRS